MSDTGYSDNMRAQQEIIIGANALKSQACLIRTFQQRPNGRYWKKNRCLA